MKTLTSIVASLYWTLFFVNDVGMYQEHMFQLGGAIFLTIVVGYMEWSEINGTAPNIRKTKGSQSITKR